MMLAVENFMKTKQYNYFFIFIFCTFFNNNSFPFHWEALKEDREILYAQIAYTRNRLINPSCRESDDTEVSLEREYQEKKDALGQHLFWAKNGNETSNLLCYANPQVKCSALCALRDHSKIVHPSISDDIWTPAHIFTACGMISSLQCLQEYYLKHTKDDLNPLEKIISEKGFTLLDIAELYRQEETKTYLNSLLPKTPTTASKTRQTKIIQESSV